MGRAEQASTLSHKPTMTAESAVIVASKSWR